MATRERFNWNEIKKGSPYFSCIKTTIETAFLKNNVYPVETLKEAYKLAAESPGAIITDIPVFEPEKIGLAADSKVLLFNDGAVKGRCAAARRIIGEPGIDQEEYAMKIRDAIYDTRYNTMYHAEAYVGLDKDFMVKAHLLIPEGEENIMYSWLLNFQYINEYYYNMYKDSKVIADEPDVYIFSDPTWSHPDHPLGLTFFDPENNCAAILGMRYFGEHKKGTLTLAWGIANRHGYAACHGGQKRYNLKDGRKYVVGVFGLSGSGKSTITHARHGGKYDITVLHDDAFIISTEDKSSIAMEPAYFDKTQDYPMADPDNTYLVSVQNNGATLDEDGKIVLVTEDIRNGNGRAIKSKLWSPNREDVFHEPVNAIIWLMKDPTLPPVLKITDPTLASAMGATLATKRTSAERLAEGVDPNALVVEPYANPFRTYPLKNDYEKFKELFDKLGVACYIFNTGHFMDTKVTVKITLDSMENIIEGKAEFTDLGIEGIGYMPFEGYIPDFSDAKYKEQFIARIKDRIGYIEKKAVERGGFDKLPEEAVASIKKVAAQAEKL
ncbi:MAG: phosphoenolpyruvate carboxykinase (ATP) [Eubacteriales bacterium]|nr:phosphoenolpyruvate carboxykinase (ATP) [Eubacteriales bacterium]